MQYELQHGNFHGRVQTKGGELVSFRDGEGTEYIWEGDPAYWAGQNPILFPIVGRLNDGKIRIGEKEFSMAQHGFARNSEFTLVASGKDFARLELQESEKTLQQYPFPFRLQVCHQLMERGFSTTFSVTNTGASALPFCLGGHTGFSCPLEPGKSLEDYVLRFEQTERATSHPLTETGLLSAAAGEPMLWDSDTLSLRYDLFDRFDTLIFSNLRSKSVSLLPKDGGKGIRLYFGDFPLLAFWTKPHARAPYLCIEPWQGHAAQEGESGDFEDKPFRLVLQPGEEKTMRIAVELITC